MSYSLASIRKDLDVLQSTFNIGVKSDIFVDDLRFSLPDPLTIPYDPIANSNVGTFERFHRDKSLIRLILGPYGSGKSTACCAEIVLQTINMPPMHDGVRRAKWAIIRNTMGMLETTTLATWNTWFRSLGHVERTKKPVLTYKHFFRDANGPIELELIFLGLDREESKQKLDSLEVTGAFLNELQHVPQGIFAHVISRIGRYPRKRDLQNNKNIKILIADSNPPDEDHWIYKYFEADPIEDSTVFHQPPGLLKDKEGNWYDNLASDNHKNLDHTYYFDMARANHFGEEFIKVYCRGEYGIVIPGRPVYPQYNDDLHSVQEVEILDDQPILLLWDFGMTPCCIFVQFSEAGQFRIIKEFVTERSSVRNLAKNFVNPHFVKNFDKFEFLSISDPAGESASQTDGVSVLDVLKDEGIPTLAAKTNKLEPRLEAVKSFLDKMVDGQPGLIISRQGAPTVRKAFAGEYCYKRVRIVGDEKYKDTPDKSHPWSDVMDAIQYGALEFVGDGLRMQAEYEYTPTLINPTF
jgi:hypothetical protein